jgi:hypothetical protein
MRTREGLPGRSPIAPNQARITLEFFCDGLPEKKLQLIGISILINPIEPWAEMSHTTPLEDRRPHRSTQSQERSLLATSVGLVPAHVPSYYTTQGSHHAYATATTRTRESVRVGSDTNCNDPPHRGWDRLRLAAL